MTLDLFGDIATQTQSKRKNNPELLRHTMILCAKDIMLTDGILHLSLQKVANMAGTSKGGLFHHFKSKEELIASVFELFIAQINTAIMQEMTDGFGAFTKAYINVLLSNSDIGLSSDWAGLIRVMTADSQMHDLWINWRHQKLNIHRATDGDARLMAIRHAVDGAWLNHIHADDMPALKDYLLRLVDDLSSAQ